MKWCFNGKQNDKWEHQNKSDGDCTLTHQMSKQVYETMSLSDLRRTREELINDLKFEEVTVVDGYIKNYEFDNSNKIMKALINEFSIKINESISKYDQKSSEIEEEALKQEVDIRMKIDESFQGMKKKHKEEITSLETERLIEIKMAKERPYSKVNELNTIAQNYARSSNIDMAIRKRNEAKQQKVMIIRQRIEDINKTYDKMLKKLIEKQERELKVLQDNLLNSLKTINNEKAEELLKAKNQTILIIKKHLRQITLSGWNKIKKNDKRNELSNKLNNFMIVKLNANKKFTGLY